MSVLRVLHLVGSAYNEFYSDLSREYAQCCLVDASSYESLYDFRIAFITPDSQWRFPRTLAQEEIAAAKTMSVSDAIQSIKEQKIDIVLPHMYCIPGMTHYRALFDLIKVPYIGNSPDVMAITAHKGKSKAIVAAAGVKVPHGELLRQGDTPTIPPPTIVKPASADNSLGVSVVRDMSAYDDALKKAFEHSNEVIVEAFIEPGREVRCSLIVRDGQLVDLPLEEFLVKSQEKPIRTHYDKFPQPDTDGRFRGWTTSDIKQHWIVNIDDPITQKVQQVAKKCHMALGCRHYSMFDFRIDPMGDVWFLEASLYCSFGYGSGIPHVAKAAGIPLDELFSTITRETLGTI
jgi:D-alanine-D-alanine ligase